jgi:hypothetical protein
MRHYAAPPLHDLEVALPAPPVVAAIATSDVTIVFCQPGAAPNVVGQPFRGITFGTHHRTKFLLHSARVRQRPARPRVEYGNYMGAASGCSASGSPP